MTELLLKDLLNKFNLNLDLPQKLKDSSIKYCSDKTKEEILSFYTDYHVETRDDNSFYVFTEKIGKYNLELLIDEKNSKIMELEILPDDSRQIQFIIDDSDIEITFN